MLLVTGISKENGTLLQKSAEVPYRDVSLEWLLCKSIVSGPFINFSNHLCMKSGMKSLIENWFLEEGKCSRYFLINVWTYHFFNIDIHIFKKIYSAFTRISKQILKIKWSFLKKYLKQLNFNLTLVKLKSFRSTVRLINVFDQVIQKQSKLLSFNNCGCTLAENSK